MLSRPATKITLTAEDIAAYEQRKLAREMMKEQELNSSQDSDKSTVENGEGSREEELTPAAQRRDARGRMTRDQRIGVGSTRG
jgi:hypothetical protein